MAYSRLNFAKLYKKLYNRETLNWIGIIFGVIVILWALGCSCRLPFINEGFDVNQKCMTLFYAPWCGHCKNFMPVWDQFDTNYHGGGCLLQKIDCDANKDLAQTHNISGFPTVRYYPSGLSNTQNFVEFDGDRSYEGLKEFYERVVGTPDNTTTNPLPLEGNTMPVNDSGTPVKTTSFVGRHFDMS